MTNIMIPGTYIVNLALQIRKIDADLEYAIVDLKPHNNLM